jgi:hypothetical protein
VSDVQPGRPTDALRHESLIRDPIRAIRARIEPVERRAFSLGAGAYALLQSLVVPLRTGARLAEHDFLGGGVLIRRRVWGVIRPGGISHQASSLVIR